MRRKTKNQKKRLVSLLAAMMMVLSMGMSALAANVANNTQHAYDAYQVFSGTQAGADAALGDVDWGSGVDGASLLTALKADARFQAGDPAANIFENASSAADVAAALSQYGDASSMAKAFANVADAHRTTAKTAIAAGASDVTLDAGYYLLVDAGTVNGNDAYNPALLQVTNKGDITIAKKYEIPTVDKSVHGPGDGDGVFDESTDAGIGDEVTFRLKGTVSQALADYETYQYEFKDTLSKGLTYVSDSMKVYLYKDGDTGNTADGNKAEVTSGFTTAAADIAEANGGGTSLTVSFTNLKTVNGVTDSSAIVAEYRAAVNSNAVIGSAGNPNSVTLVYSNNPNTGGTGSTGETQADRALVFTYVLDVTKVDGADQNKKLAGAEFVLLNSDKSKAAKVTGGRLVGWVDDSTITKNQDGTYPADYTLTSAEATGQFSVEGLDAGTYYLKETKAPSGYNKLTDPVKVVVSATLDGTEDNPALTALAIKVDDGNESAGDPAAGKVAMNVRNNSGSTLPETGGMGTAVFYIVGAILVVGAAVLLVVKRRMDAEK